MKKILMTISLLITTISLILLVGCNQDDNGIISKFISENNTIKINSSDVAYISLTYQKNKMTLTKSQKEQFLEDINKLNLSKSNRKKESVFGYNTKTIKITLKDTATILLADGIFKLDKYLFYKSDDKTINRVEIKEFSFDDIDNKLSKLFNSFYDVSSQTINNESYEYNYIFERDDVDSVKLYLGVNSKEKVLTNEEIEILKKNIYTLPIEITNSPCMCASKHRVVITYKNKEQDTFRERDSYIQRNDKILVFNILGLDNFIQSKFAK